MAKMNGQTVRSIEFIDAIPLHHTSSYLSIGRFRSYWQTCDELLLLEISRASENHEVVKSRRKDLHNTIFLLPAALQARKVHLVSGIPVDMHSGFYYSRDTGSIPKLQKALTALRTTSFSYRDRRISGLKPDSGRGSEFLTGVLALPTLRRLDLESARYFDGSLGRPDILGWPLASANLPRFEQWCTRLIPGTKNAPEEATAATISSPQVMRGKLASLIFIGGAFKLEDFLTILSRLSPSLDELTLDQVMLISSTMFDVLPRTEIETIISNFKTSAGAPIHPMVPKITHFLVSETLLWEQVLDFLRDARISQTTAGTHPSARKVSLRLRGFATYDKNWVDNPSDRFMGVPIPLVRRLGWIWIPGFQQPADPSAAGCGGPLVYGMDEWGLAPRYWGHGKGLNAAEEYIMWQRDSNPIREYRVNLVAGAIEAKK